MCELADEHDDAVKELEAAKAAEAKLQGAETRGYAAVRHGHSEGTPSFDLQRARADAKQRTEVAKKRLHDIAITRATSP